jgi:hypothetical protein
MGCVGENMEQKAEISEGKNADTIRQKSGELYSVSKLRSIKPEC